MRGEREMMDSILGFAQDDERVRAAVLNGSRVNPRAPRDRFQDYDAVFFVSSVEDFVRDRSWIRRFGELTILQTPDEMGSEPRGNNDKFAFLMLFADGNRIDLTLYPAVRMAGFRFDSLSVLLLDKDGIVPPLPAPSDKDYLPEPPTDTQFAHCCNEFWWVGTYVAKGLWRRELPYAKAMFDGPVRDMLLQMLTWHIGIRTGFAVNPGKCGKYMEKLLRPEQWTAFVKTYPDAHYDNIWQALFVMCDLFRETAREVAAFYGYVYPEEDDRRVSAYLRRVKELPNG